MAKSPKIVIPSTLYDAIEDVPEYVLGRVMKMCFIYCLDADTIMYPQQQAFEMWNTDPYVRQVFKFFKQHLDESIDKYHSIVERNRKNGSMGGRPKSLSQATAEELQERLVAIMDGEVEEPKPRPKREKKPEPVATSFLKELYPGISNSTVYTYDEPLSIPDGYPNGFYSSVSN